MCIGRRDATGFRARGLRRTTRAVDGRRAAVLRATVFLAAGFLATVLRATVFLAAGFLTVAFFTAGRRTVVFRAVVARARVPVVRAVGRRLAAVRGFRAVLGFFRATDAIVWLLSSVQPGRPVAQANS